jgi:hypothetical protein
MYSLEYKVTERSYMVMAAVVLVVLSFLLGYSPGKTGG